jgi:hypothetical protein
VDHGDRHLHRTGQCKRGHAARVHRHKDLGATYDYLVETILITGTAGETGGGTSTPALTAGFEEGTDGWAARGDGVTVTRSTAAARTGSASLLVTGRTQPWHGATVDVTSSLPVGQAVAISV